MKVTLAELLSFTTGKFMSKDMTRLFALCHFFVGHDFRAAHLGIVGREVGEVLKTRFPDIAPVVPPLPDPNWLRTEPYELSPNQESWLREQEQVYGNEFEVQPLAEPIEFPVTETGHWVKSDGSVVHG